MNARRFYTILLVIGALALSGLGGSSVRAATINVACNPNALIAAINTANGNGQTDTLNLSAGCTYIMTAENNNTDGPNFLPSIASEITVNGNGAKIEGDGSRIRILHVGSSGDLTLNQVTVSGGLVTGLSGSGIYNRGTLTLVDSTLTQNGANVSDCAAIDNVSTGVATLIDSRIVNNGVGSNNSGGGLCNSGTMTLTNTTVHGNGAGYGGGGGILNGGTLEIYSSTISDNGAFAFFGEAVGSCGGIENGGMLTVHNSTISGNWTVDAGGGLCNSGEAELVNSTIAGNRANAGAGIANSGTLTLRNTIVSTQGQSSNCSGDPITSLGYNLDSDGTCGLSAVGDQPNADPLLTPLGDYGGPTRTHALRNGSPALDQGTCPAATADQRGLARPFDLINFADADDGCDIGAFEAQHPLLNISPQSAYSNPGAGEVDVQELTVGNDGPLPLTFELDVIGQGVDLLLPLDEAAGATTFRDLSGYGRDGTCEGAACPTAGVTGQTGTALSFDGVDDRVTAPLRIDQWVDSRGATMMAWVYPASTSSGRHMVISSDDGGYDWSLLREGGTWYVYTGEASRSAGQSVDVDQWQHIAVAFDPNINGVRFYKNGVETTIPYFDYDTGSSALSIGNRPGTINRPFDGRIDEVQVYDRALSALEIGHLYQGIPWLSIAPLNGTVPAYGSMQVDVSFDATALAEGVYGAQIVVQSNDISLPLLHVPVDMIVGGTWNEIPCDVDHLIAALRMANANDAADVVPDTLHLAAGCVYTLIDIDNDTEGPNGLPTINGEMTLEGNGAIVEGPGYDGSGRVLRILYVAQGGDLTLNNLTLRKGVVYEQDGGAILNRGMLQLAHSAVTENWGEHADGVGIYNASSGAVTLNSSRVSDNYLHDGKGVGIHNAGTMTLNSSTVGDNTRDGGWESGAGISNEGTLILSNSTVSGNHTDFGSGGIGNGGTVTLLNSTVSGNRSDYHDGGGILNSGVAELINSTVTDNGSWAENCGGLSSSGTVTLTNTVIANQQSGTDCNGTIASLGYNLDSDGTCGLTQPTDLPNADPLLGPLQDNGGPTETHALLEGSPAVDQGSCPQTMADQRGQPRHVDAPGIDNADDACDVGAYEAQAGTPLGVVRGTITAAVTGDPLAATLSLLPTAHTMTSDPESGAYSIWWATGTYTLQVSAPDYLTQTASVELDALAASNQDFVLELEQVQLFLPIVFR